MGSLTACESAATLRSSSGLLVQHVLLQAPRGSGSEARVPVCPHVRIQGHGPHPSPAHEGQCARACLGFPGNARFSGTGSILDRVMTTTAFSRSAQPYCSKFSRGSGLDRGNTTKMHMVDRVLAMKDNQKKNRSSISEMSCHCSP